MTWFAACIGDEALQQEAVELMLDDVYPQVIRKKPNINPSGPGKLEEIVKMDPPTFCLYYSPAA